MFNRFIHQNSSAFFLDERWKTSVCMISNVPQYTLCGSGSALESINDQNQTIFMEVYKYFDCNTSHRMDCKHPSECCIFSHCSLAPSFFRGLFVFFYYWAFFWRVKNHLKRSPLDSMQSRFIRTTRNSARKTKNLFVKIKRLDCVKNGALVVWPIAFEMFIQNVLHILISVWAMKS